MEIKRLKADLRKALRSRLENLSGPNRAQWSSLIRTKVSSLLSWYSRDRRLADLRVSIYASFRNEVDTIDIIRELLINQQDSLWIPRCNGNGLAVARIRSFEDLESGSFGVLEPRFTLPVLEDRRLLDVIIVPGIGFDAQCRRLGRGKGYYDRFLSDAGNGPLKVALAYDAQIVDRIPFEEHDQALDLVVTPTRIYRTDESLRLPRGLS
jgi:5-formyltetrahydrofolate cyclo-ligase